MMSDFFLIEGILVHVEVKQGNRVDMVELEVPFITLGSLLTDRKSGIEQGTVLEVCLVCILHFHDKQEFICVEIAKFNKSLDELETLYDKWLYALKNLYKLTQRPKALCDKVFDRLFEEAEIARFTPQEQREYEASKMAYRDIKNSIDTAKREGKEEGLAEGMEKGLAEGMEKGLAEGMEKGMNQRSFEIARKMLANGMDAATVMEITGLSAEEILLLKREK